MKYVDFFAKVTHLRHTLKSNYNRGLSDRRQDVTTLVECVVLMSRAM